ncbi:DNA/RNA helicase domain-containing protein [Myxacorys almedinensis]|uniref:DUF2075 domain-containing protein n=1 Tax=Myxacorys almedinensis A TaxID=2690445 RepID=A0A8J7YW89_9CYAN|nr:DNA/RNA helicase domain-containing protein [Myxacorys almedinensis]NDJ15822.1 DUF2075 domain-containing protein [Myxacorys almedinensis A]
MSEHSQPLAINYGWLGKIARFLSTSPDAWLETLSANYQSLYRQRSTATQQQAWVECGEILRSQLFDLVSTRPGAAAWVLVFEYELPNEGGRRPDVVILGAGHILVFEFKQKSTPSSADIDQVAAYARDLAEYHSASSHHPVTAILIPTRMAKENRFHNTSHGTVEVINPATIATYLHSLKQACSEIDANAWINAEYSPLPTVIQAARQIFHHQSLPTLKTAHSAGIPQLLAYLNRLAKTAEQNKERHLVLITGVPGAGKTLVGLQFVYQNPWQTDEKRSAIFLTGNAPLLTVLQYALKSKAFVQAVRNFYIQYEMRRQSAPKEHIIVFDEAQRAWDRDRMSEKYGISSAAAGAVIGICDRIPDWCVLVGLIGEGQQIHVGEEDGIEQWNLGFEAISSNWHVHCATKPSQLFTEIPPDRLHPNDDLNLTTSLRIHLAKQVQNWVTHVLLGEFDQAATIAPTLRAEGFDTYLTRDLEFAKSYSRDRYHNQSEKRYGFVASSRARNLTQYGIRNDYISTQKLNVGAWYTDPADSLLSCCALNGVVTEFSCQGLELDFPIVSWGNDLIWQDQAWVSTTRQRNVRDPLRLRLNSYRVLLTRGRDGFIIFVPPDAKMDSTFEALKLTGLQVNLPISEELL